MTDIFAVALVLQVLRITIPYALAALGGSVVERAGVVDLALEAKLLVGAFTAMVAADATGNLAVAIAAGAAGGLAVAALQALACVRLRGDAIVVGVALNLAAAGLTRYLLMAIYRRGANSPDTVGWGGAMLGNPLFWITLIAVPATALLIARTPLGLRIRAAGDHPEAARAAGVDVDRVRLAALAIGGALAGLGGAQLALSNRSFYTDISGGRGYVALAAVIMGRWRPLAAAAACLCFGAAEVLQLQLQSMDIGIPSELARLTPYIVTLLVLVGVVGRSTPPRALGKPAD